VERRGVHDRVAHRAVPERLPLDQRVLGRLARALGVRKQAARGHWGHHRRRR